MHACMFVYICMDMCAYMFIYVHGHMCICVHICAWMCVYIFTRRPKLTWEKHSLLRPWYQIMEQN